MENKPNVLYLILVVLAIVIDAAESAPNAPVTAYVNHTVGNGAGWFFNSTTNKASVDYSAWAATQSFNLGDYLIFNTNTNQTVIQTYNATTYKSCSIDDALDSDTFQYQGGENDFGKPITIPVPLTIEGPQYYFSNADDGIQCQHGLAFEIRVGHGLGLPPSLNQPPPPPYVEPPSTVEEGQTPTTTIVSTPPNKGVTVGDSLSWTALVASLALYLFVERA